MPALLRKAGETLFVVFVIGASVWYQPQGKLLPIHKVELNDTQANINLPANVFKPMAVVVKDAKGNPFQMRQLKGTQYPHLVKNAMRDAEILLCHEYTYAGEKWYEWCTEEAGQWVLYRWEKGQTTLRRVI